MKYFTRNENISGLRAADCEWLSDMGLKETRWILDAEWILFFYGKMMTFNKWIKEEK